MDWDDGSFAAWWEGVKAFPQSLGPDLISLAHYSERWIGFPSVDSTSEVTIFFTVVSILAATVMILLGSLEYIVKNMNLVLSYDDQHLFLERGLFTKTRITILRERIQEFSYSSNVRERMVKRCKLHAKQSSSSKTHALDIPYVDMKTTDTLAQLVYQKDSFEASIDPLSERFFGISKIYFYVNLFKSTFLQFPILVALIAFVFPFSRELLWPYSLAVLPLYWVWDYLDWKKEGYFLTKDHIVRRSGVLGYSVKVLPIQKIQNVTIYQSLIQRLRGTCAFRVHFVSGKVAIPYIPRRSDRQCDQMFWRLFKDENLNGLKPLRI